MIISTDAEKSLCNIQHILLIKNKFSKQVIKGNLLKLIKDIYEKYTETSFLMAKDCSQCCLWSTLY